MIEATVTHLPTSHVTNRIKHVYVIFTSHIDTGFDHPLDEMEEWCKSVIDDAIDKCERYPAFKWTIENTWQLSNWFKRTREKKKIDKLLRLIRKGRIEVGAAWDDIVTDFLGYEDVNRLFYKAGYFMRAYGINFSTVIMDDIPGYSITIPRAMAAAGLKYFLTGINPLHDYWGAGTSIPPSDLPFYWEGPDGSRVLAWISFGSYGEATSKGYELWQKAGKPDFPWLCALDSQDYQKMKESFKNLIQKWEKAGYPFDALLIMHALDCIDCSLAVRALENIRRWNEENGYPKIIPAVPREFFEHMKDKYRNRFKRYSGDWAGAWTGGKQIVYPISTAMVRWARDHITAAEKIWSIDALLYGADYPAEEIRRVYELILTWLDHTQSPHTPEGRFTEEEMRRDARLRYGLASGAFSITNQLIQKGFKRLISGIEADKPSIIVFNPLSWCRTDIVYVCLSEEIIKRNFSLLDSESNMTVPYQRIPGENRIAFIAESVPPIGYKKYEIIFVDEPESFEKKVYANGNFIENFYYRIEVDDEGFISSLIDKAAHRELINRNSVFIFNRLYEKMPRAAGINPVSAGRARIKAISGPVFGSLVIERENSPQTKTVYTLYAKIKRIEISNSIDKSLLGCSEKAVGHFTEGQASFFFITCPFNLTDMDHVNVHIERAGFFLSCPDKSRLPGAQKQPFSHVHITDINEGGKYGLTLSTKQSFLCWFPGDPMLPIDTRRWSPRECTLMLAVCNNHKKYLTKDKGVVEFQWESPSIPIINIDYSIDTYMGQFNAVKASRMGWEFNVQLMSSFVRQGQSGPLKDASLSFLEVDKPNIQIITLKRKEVDSQDRFIIRLQEISEMEGDLKIRSYFPIKEARYTSLLEDPKEIKPSTTDPIKIKFKPYQTITLELCMKQKTSDTN